MDLSERPEHQSRRHPWELARFKFLSKLLDRHTSFSDPVRILDAGAGDGWFSSQLLARLPSGSSSACWDVFYTAEDLEALAGHHPSSMSFSAKVPEERFDLILLLDVLEHVEDDWGFLGDLVQNRLAGPGSVLLFSVPAWQILFSQHDTNMRHFRRYSSSGARKILQDCGLEIVSSMGFFHTLLAPRIAQRGLELLLRKSNRPASETTQHDLGWTRGSLVSSLVDSALALDNAVSSWTATQGWNLPGLSFGALCRKP